MNATLAKEWVEEPMGAIDCMTVTPGAFFVNSLNSYEPEAPVLPEKALLGIAGEIIRKIEPHTETHPASLLMQLLVGFGNIVGREAYFLTERDKHHTNLFAVIVGISSRGRKGTSWGHIKHLLAQVDPAWEQSKIMGGIASGEGIIAELKDEEGVEVRDKRLLLFEGEFSQVLQVATRPGNTVSAILRNAWDSGELRNMSKGSPLRASGCHISMIGHITRAELSHLLTKTDASNGFGNRILWTHSSRTKLLPDGGELDSVDFSNEIRFLKMARELARKRGKFLRSSEARDYWHAIYPALGEELPGLAGQLTSRAEAQVVRLALVFCLLEGGEEICLDHLQAAEALWTYCRDSARWAVMDSRFSRNAQKLLVGLQNAGTAGLNRSQITKGLFGGNIKAEELEAALKEITPWMLEKNCKETGGAPSTTYILKSP
jgi:hypothetical protein